jgi:hypothetical protein
MIRFTAQATIHGCLHGLKRYSRSVGFGFGFGLWGASGLSLDGGSFQSCLDFGIVDGFFLVVEIMVGGYHLIMSVISFIAFRRAVLGDVRYGKSSLPPAVDCVSYLLHRTRPRRQHSFSFMRNAVSVSVSLRSFGLRDSGNYAFA